MLFSFHQPLFATINCTFSYQSSSDNESQKRLIHEARLAEKAQMISEHSMPRMIWRKFASPWTLHSSIHSKQVSKVIRLANEILKAKHSKRRMLFEAFFLESEEALKINKDCNFAWVQLKNKKHWKLNLEQHTKVQSKIVRSIWTIQLAVELPNVISGGGNGNILDRNLQSKHRVHRAKLESLIKWIQLPAAKLLSNLI